MCDTNNRHSKCNVHRILSDDSQVVYGWVIVSCDFELVPKQKKLVLKRRECAMENVRNFYFLDKDLLTKQFRNLFI